MTKSTQIILGPPGTGKTTLLLDIVQDYLETSPKANIGFFSFTTKATNEAKHRMVMSLGLDPRDPVLFYFRTLHSLAFHLVGMHRDSMMSDAQFRNFGDLYGYDINIKTVFDGFYTYTTPDDELYKEYQFKSTKGERLDSVELETFAKDFREFKEGRMLYDFTDLIHLAVNHPLLPSFDLLCIDEAQDLSPLQWGFVEKLMARSRNCYVAGDDDQSIYTFAGADVDTFINLEGNVRVLDESHRLSPELVEGATQFIANNVKFRREKDFHGNNMKNGKIHHIYDPQECDLSRDTWLLLCRHIWQMAVFEEICREQGLKYNSRNLPKQEQDPKARIQINTIHSVKGGEADHVMLATDISKRVYNSMDEVRDFENECRVFYVGMTRTKGDLYILEPQTELYMEI